MLNVGPTELEALHEDRDWTDLGVGSLAAKANLNEFKRLVQFAPIPAPGAL
jgi:hypothetical protein